MKIKIPIKFVKKFPFFFGHFLNEVMTFLYIMQCRCYLMENLLDFFVVTSAERVDETSNEDL